MRSAHRFEDEWLVSPLSQLPGITADKIANARSATHPSIVKALLDAKLLTAQDFEGFLKKRYQLEMAPRALPSTDRSALGVIPQKVCMRRRVVPLALSEGTVSVAMQNPLDLEALSDLRSISSRTILPLYATPEQITNWLDVLFNPEALVSSILEKLPHEDTRVQVVGDRESGGPVAQLINQILARAIHQGASDIHLEHAETYSSIRFRIDGLLQNVLTLPKELAVGPMVSRIKVISNLDLANHFRPQDGGAKIRTGDHDIALRISILPTHYGEKVVIRLLDSRAAEVTFEGLGLQAAVAKRVEGYLEREQGIILVTGPTGVGKTTTLYAMLNRLKSERSNLVTVEDPIEYKLDGINQVQINDKQGLTFAGVIRSVMRQDPDIILIGEIRDLETAEVAIQAALTGHLVLSTLHTNDTVSTVSRLSDLGLEGYKIASSVSAIMSQRLIRRLCAECKRPVDLNDMSAPLKQAFAHYGDVALFESRGCARCFFSGYRGRLPIVELLQTDVELCRAISKGMGEIEVREIAVQRGLLLPLDDDALWHVAQGHTSIREVMPHLRTAFTDTKGSKETVVLPSVRLPPESPAGTPKRNVLVIEDDNVTRLLIRTALERGGYQVEEASNGRIGLEKLATLKPDALILDIQMPEIDGYEVLRGVRHVLGLADLPVLVLTVHAEEEIKQKVLAAGSHDYLTKPFDPTSLLARVESLFKRQSINFEQAA